MKDDGFLPRHPLGRTYLIACLLLAEYAVIVSVDHPWCHLHRVVAGTIVFCTVYLFLARSFLKQDMSCPAFSAMALSGHILSLAVVGISHFLLLKTEWHRSAALVVWFVSIPCSVILLIAAFLPWNSVRAILRQTRVPLVYSAIAASTAMVLSDAVQNVWNLPQAPGSIFLQRLTFKLVGWSLHLIYGNVTVDPANFAVNLPNFAVTIAGSCSGIEGLSLTLLFTAGWLWYSRLHLRFPRAFLLMPAALLLIYILNLFRIDLLLAIGNAGYSDIAVHGFHSEAGWIAFNVVALLFLVVADRAPWFARVPGSPSADRKATSLTAQRQHRNVPAIYLLPFVIILASGFLSRAVSGGFEWLYPLRLAAALAAFWRYRNEYRGMNWRFGWQGPLGGIAVFVMWIGISHIHPSAPGSNFGAALAALSPTQRMLWLVVRIAAATITVPIAEELAFRGYLMRRLTDENIESIPYTAVTLLALILSSVIFGVMHGNMWLAGCAAGLSYGLLSRRTGRLGDAIAAHSTTNLLLAIWVLATKDWSLW